MIKVAELRIGNFVSNGTDNYALLSFSLNGEPGIDLVPCNSESIDLCRNAEWKQIHPIPLTAEILEKAGFEKKSGLLSYKYFEYSGKTIDLHLQQMGDFFIRVMVTQFCTYQWPQEIKYVHQLQNLTFAISGKELEIIL